MTIVHYPAEHRKQFLNHDRFYFVSMTGSITPVNHDCYYRYPEDEKHHAFMPVLDLHIPVSSSYRLSYL